MCRCRNIAVPAWAAWVCISGLVLLAGCRQDMADQPQLQPLEASSFFADGRASRDPPPGTVARGQLRIDDHFYLGKVEGELVQTFPERVTAAMLDRGQERYNIFCAPCHDRVGNGRGMVVRRGFPPPPSLHIDRLRTAPPGHFFDVISNGFGRMPDYRDQIPTADRWAIVAYIEALQLSQHAGRDQLTESILRQLSP